MLSTHFDPDKPGRRVQWSSHDIMDFQRCPWLYYARHILRYRRRSDGKMTFGTAVHEGLDTYHRTEGDNDTRLVAAVRDALAWAKELPALVAPKGRSKINVVRCLVEWADEYGVESGEWLPLAPEAGEASEVKFEIPLLIGADGTEFFLRGTIDRIVATRRGISILDTKTTGMSPGRYFFDRFSPDGQMSTYDGAAVLLFGEDYSRELIVEAFFIRSLKREGDSVQVLRETIRMVDGPEAIEDAKHWVAEADKAFLAGHWPRNRQGCTGLYGRCVYAGVCSQKPKLRKSILEQEFDYTPLDTEDRDEDDGWE